MTDRNAISVIMPVHNAGRYLQPAVESILNQIAVKLELVLIDDHSTDGAVEQQSNDPRIKRLSSSKLGIKHGIVPALNAAIDHAQYDIIARMDGDDLALPSRLSTQLNFLNDHPEIDIVGSKVEIFSDDGEIGKGYQIYQEWLNSTCSPKQIADNFFVESCIPHPSAMLRRSTLKRLGGYRDTPWPEDYDLWCRAYLAGCQFAKPTGDIMLRWRDHSKRTSRASQRYSKQQFLQCKAHYLSKLLLKKNRTECIIWGVGPTGLKLHDYLEHNGIIVTSFIDINPKMRGRRKRGKPVNVLSTQSLIDEFKKTDAVIIVAVSARGAREKIRQALTKPSQILQTTCSEPALKELDDFIFAA